MLGQMIYGRGGWRQPVPANLYGLSVMRTQAEPERWLGEWKLKQAGKRLQKGGIRRVLTPDGFGGWPILNEYGLRPVDTVPLVRAQSTPLTLELLRRDGMKPTGATVALCGTRVDRDMERAAFQLSCQVRRVIIAVPQGGEVLAARLRRELGVPILPPAEGAHVAVCFTPEQTVPARKKLYLCGPRPDLAGMQLSVPELEEEDRADLPLLTALWEGGRLMQRDLKIT